MAENLELKVTLGADEFLKSIRQMQNALGDLGKEAKKLQGDLDNVGKKGSSGLKGLTKDAKELTGIVTNLGKQIGGVFGSGVGGAIGGGLTAFKGILTFDLPTAAQGFAEIISAAVRGFVDGVKYATKTLADQSKIFLSYALTLGGYGKGTGFFPGNPAAAALNDIARFTPQTAYGRQETAKILQQLYKTFGKGAGIGSPFDLPGGRSQIRDAFAAATDVAAMSPEETRIQNTELTLEFLKMTKVRGGFWRRQLHSLAMSVGFTTEEFYTQLGQMLGGVSKEEAMHRAIKGEDPKVGAAAREIFYRIIEEKIKAAGIGPDAFGRFLGRAGEEESKTLGAVLNKIFQLPIDLFGELAKDNSVKEFTSSLKGLYDVLAPGPNGPGPLFDGLRDLFYEFTAQVKKIKPEDIISFVKDLSLGLIEIIKAMPTIVKFFAELLHDIAFIISHIPLGAKGLELSIGILLGLFSGKLQKIVGGIGELVLKIPGIGTAVTAVTEAIGGAGAGGLLGSLAALAAGITAAAGIIYFEWDFLDRQKTKGFGRTGELESYVEPPSLSLAPDKGGYFGQVVGKVLDFLGVPDYSNDASPQGIKNRQGSKYIPTETSKPTSGNEVKINAPITLNITGVSPDDTHAHLQIGKSVADMIVRSIEQGAQQAGRA